MADIFSSGLLSGVPTVEQLLGEKRMYAKIVHVISKTERLVHQHTDRQTDMAKSTRLVTLIIYIFFIGSPTFSTERFKCPDKLNLPRSEHKNITEAHAFCKSK